MEQYATSTVTDYEFAEVLLDLTVSRWATLLYFIYYYDDLRLAVVFAHYTL